MATIDFDSYPVLKYWTAVRAPLFEILATLHNRVDRDLRAEVEARSPGMRMWLLTNLRVARQTHEVIEEISDLAKKKTVPYSASVAIPPLARVILESLVGVTFVFESPTTLLPWFWKATWRGLVEKLAEYTADYGHDPEWQDWIKGIDSERQAWEQLLAKQGTPLTSAELVNPRAIDHWPTPGRMKKLLNDPVRKAKLAYLNARYYGDLSGKTHLSGLGLLAQGGAFLDQPTDDNQRKYFSDQVLTSMTVLFGLATQLTLDVDKTPALARRIQGLWRTDKLWLAATEMYDRCYRTDIEQLAAAG